MNVLCKLVQLLDRDPDCNLDIKVSDKIIFPIKFSSEFLQIFYSDSLYHTYQYVYVGDYKLIYILLFFAFLCLLFAPTRGAFLVHFLNEDR